LEQVEAYVDEVIAYADRRMGAVIERIPDGVYHGSGWVDSDGYDVRNVPIEVTVEVRGDRVVVDYEGTGAQAAGGFNGSEATTLTSGRLPFLFYADSDIPHNQGCFDHIEVKAPKGSIANPEYPGSTSCATIVPSGMLHDAINKALVEAVPDMVHAGTARCSNVPQFFGVDEQNGEEWSMMIFNNCGGSGATKEADGWPLLESVGAMGGQKALPIEQMELLYPVRVEEMEIEQDSMGLGTTIGGFGVRFTLRPLRGAMECITFGDGAANPPHGILGGTAAIGGGQFVEEVESKKRTYVSASGHVRIAQGDTWTGVATGGGGYGAPFERPAERVAEEVRDEVISRDAAFEVFGVVLSEGEDPALDVAATEARRAKLAEGELALVTPTEPEASTWVAKNLGPGDVYLENPTVH
jgi:N-methylhydantoinase B